MPMGQVTLRTDCLELNTAPGYSTMQLSCTIKQHYMRLAPVNAGLDAETAKF